MIDEQRLGGMSIGALNELVDALRARKEDNAKRMAEAGSPIGLSMLARKKAELEAIRNRYMEIGVDDDAHAVVRRLVANISNEKMIRSDIRHLESPVSVSEELDKELAQCHDMLTKKKAAAARSR